MAKCGNNINKHKNKNSIILKSFKSFVWKNTNWREIELRLNIIQNKIYVAKQDNNIAKVKKLQKLVLKSYDLKKLAVRKVTQLTRGKKTAGIDGIKNLDEKQRVWLVDNWRIKGEASSVRKVMIQKPNDDVKYWSRRVITPNLKFQVEEKLLKLQNYQ